MRSVGQPLCKNCGEKDTFWRVKGTVYEQYVGCAYEKQNYPKVYDCPQYNPKQNGHEAGS